MPKRILFLTFYYKPDLCAGSFRASALVDSFLKQTTDEVIIDVVTTIPNRYNTFKVKADEIEKIQNVTINRIDIPLHKSGFLDQAKSFSRYFFQSLKKTKSKKYDLVIATSSRLFTAFLGAYISRRTHTPLYLDIRDIFTDTMNDVLKSRILKFFALPVFKLIERFTFNSATWINLVSEGFRPYFESKYKKNYTFHTNGIDPEFLGLDFQKSSTDSKKIITYAGNIGDGQGLHVIVPEAANLLKEDYEFWIIGDGGMREKLKERIAKQGLKNVKLIDPVNRKELKEYYKKSDFLFLHLNNYKAFEKVLPSKIFEYAVTGKPMIAGVGGYAARFIKENLSQTILFDPCDAETFSKKMQQYENKKTDLSGFINKYSRVNIMDDMVTEFLEILEFESITEV